MLVSGTKEPPAAPQPASVVSPCTRKISGNSSKELTDTGTYTESALRELYHQVNNMPESAKKKKLIRQVSVKYSFDVIRHLLQLNRLMCSVVVCLV